MEDVEDILRFLLLFTVVFVFAANLESFHFVVFLVIWAMVWKFFHVYQRGHFFVLLHAQLGIGVSCLIQFIVFIGTQLCFLVTLNPPISLNKNMVVSELFLCASFCHNCLVEYNFYVTHRDHDSTRALLVSL